MKDLGLVAVIVAVWLIFRNRSQAATNAGNPLDPVLTMQFDSPKLTGIDLGPAPVPFGLEGLPGLGQGPDLNSLFGQDVSTGPYNLPDIVGFGADGVLTTDLNGNWIGEQPLASARPN
jgi:hypothetical protein